MSKLSKFSKIRQFQTFLKDAKSAFPEPSISYGNNLIFFIFIRFPAILLVKTIDSYLHEVCARGILHSDFQ